MDKYAENYMKKQSPTEKQLNFIQKIIDTLYVQNLTFDDEKSSRFDAYEFIVRYMDNWQTEMELKRARWRKESLKHSERKLERASRNSARTQGIEIGIEDLYMDATDFGMQAWGDS